jgi:NtrC-family two-component system response regulator AlgB
MVYNEPRIVEIGSRMTDDLSMFATDQGVGSLRVMVVDDEPTIRAPLGLCLETLGHRIYEAASVEEGLAIANRESLDVAMLDLRLGTGSGLDLMARLLAVQPRVKIIIITAYGSVDMAVRAMARGATDILCKPFTPEQVAISIARAGALRGLEADVAIAADRQGTAAAEADFATTSRVLQEAVTVVRRVAPTDMPVLLTGEPGTGKAVLARALHGWGRRPEGPFLNIDCAAHSTGYVDLALFGDTLAGEQLIGGDKTPLVMLAGGGTLLIRHVEHLSERSRERLSRLVETRTFESEGIAPLKCDCRVVMTMDVGIGEVDARFGARLERVRADLPPLRERPDDIPMLAQRYLAFARQGAVAGEGATGQQVQGFSVEALDRLVGYSWPGNLRELHGVVNEAFAAADEPYIQSRHLRASVEGRAPSRRPRAGDLISLKDLEIAHIREVLGGKRTLQEASEILGLDPQALYRRRRQYGIE